MKTLILNGSPRKNGDTAALLAALRLSGEVEIVDAFQTKVSPCLDCRYCRTHAGCSIKDGMEELYRKIEESDRIILASPIWFGTLPGPLLTPISRAQTLFSGRFFRKEPKKQGKKGAIILVGGGSGGAESALATAKMILRELGVEGEIPQVTSLATDRIPAAEDQAALEGLRQIEAYLA